MGGNPHAEMADLFEAAAIACKTLAAAEVTFALCGRLFRPVQRPVTAQMLADVDLLPVGSVRLPVLSGTELLIDTGGTVTDRKCDMSSHYDWRGPSGSRSTWTGSVPRPRSPLRPRVPGAGGGTPSAGREVGWLSCMRKRACTGCWPRTDAPPSFALA
jgi:hypothetical protein